MLISWNWLKEYVRLDMPVETLTERLMMAGLNLEEVTDVEGDLCIDLEVTSNRPDCLGHLGVARETAVLFDRECKVPAAAPKAAGPAVSSLTSVKIDALDLCPRYLARLVRGVKIGPSPSWLKRRLTTIGVRSINNVVDVTNYVLMECGQPLHAFDFDKLQGKQIVVRRAKAGEKILAIDQAEYPLTPEMCVIADAERPVAVAGVMGGLETEIGDATTSVLIEVAEFASMSVRSTARRLRLHSPSSYRFERGVDAANLDWASRRCAELILQTAGGELCEGVIYAGSPPPATRPSIRLRHSQFRRILGIDVPADEVLRILKALGLSQVAAGREACEFTPPSWRRDLTREIDLIEEVARIHGYDKIPEDVPVPMAVSSTTLQDRVIDKAAGILTAAGFSETITPSLVSEKDLNALRPWDDASRKQSPLKVSHSDWDLESVLRRSIVPSLLSVRRYNERHGVPNAQLFEVARIYLKAEPGQPGSESLLISAISGRSFGELKGVLEALAAEVNHRAEVTTRAADRPEFVPGRGCEVLLNGRAWGWLGEVAESARHQYDLNDPVTAFEVEIAGLEAIADLHPQFVSLPRQPGVERDVNLVLDESITWQEVAQTLRGAAGPLLQNVAFASQYRGQQIPASKKSYVARLHFLAPDRTLTAEEVDTAVQTAIQACAKSLGAVQR